MVFNSFEYGGFLAVIFLAYWMFATKRPAWQNHLLLGASYLFYGWWDWRFTMLLAGATLADYWLGFRIGQAETESARKRWLMVSLVMNLGLLGFFKYYNFFLDSFLSLFQTDASAAGVGLVRVALPLGISFFTFLRMTYPLDIYWRKMEPVADLPAFATFSAFFPLILAGPIERAATLLPQFRRGRVFSYTLALDGMRQMLWGLFKKVVVADNIAVQTADIFGRYEQLSATELLLGAFYFAIQLYCDFSGYSDMAIATGKLLGIRIQPNFNYPYLSKNITEFWRRWHISLSNWFRDYLFTPLMIAFRNQGTAGVVASLLISFTLIGLWHGANWTYVVFGLLHGVILSFETLTKKRRKAVRKAMPASLYDYGSMFLTFAVWCLTLVFFQSATLSDALAYTEHIFTGPVLPANFRYFDRFSLSMTLVVLSLDLRYQRQEYPMQTTSFPGIVRWGLYLAAGLAVFNFIQNKQAFIYFQF
ncbi:MAG: hypothetical protein RLY31_917 [Bacteroidota bacterium]|jgi:D-alanyl-lipoteichoic acid acyltransferase DltB (MBOAT superfamily)